MNLYRKNIAENVKIGYALSNLEGIGVKSSLKICNKLGISHFTQLLHLSNRQKNQIRKIIDQEYVVRRDYIQKTKESVDSSIVLGKYKGMRHSLGLSVRGQNTQNNCKTQKKLYRGRLFS